MIAGLLWIELRGKETRRDFLVLATVGFGVLISSVSQNQGQAIQLAMMTLLPQVLLSGLIFPLSSIAIGVPPDCTRSGACGPM